MYKFQNHAVPKPTLIVHRIVPAMAILRPGPPRSAMPIANPINDSGMLMHPDTIGNGHVVSPAIPSTNEVSAMARPFGLEGPDCPIDAYIAGTTGGGCSGSGLGFSEPLCDMRSPRITGPPGPLRAYLRA